MSETRSRKKCGKDKSLGAPGPLPERCLAKNRDVFLATEYVTGGEEATAEAVKDQVKHLFSVRNGKRNQSLVCTLMEGKI